VDNYTQRPTINRTRPVQQPYRRHAQQNAPQKKQSGWKTWHKVVVGVLLLLLVVVCVATCSGGSGAKSIDPTEDNISRVLKNGIDFGGTKVTYPGDIESVTLNGTGTEEFPYWIVITAFEGSPLSQDTLLTSNVKSAAALSYLFRDDARVERVVWNGRALSSDSQEVPIMQVIYMTKNTPQNDALADALLSRSDTYYIEDILYSGLNQYKDVPQKKE